MAVASKYDQTSLLRSGGHQDDLCVDAAATRPAHLLVVRDRR
ncbi:MAG: hypothetical protein V9E94_01725 [Microthrixaceae bacterium]